MIKMFLRLLILKTERQTIQRENLIKKFKTKIKILADSSWSRTGILIKFYFPFFFF